MKILIACEFSGIVRDAFIARGHDAWSCDLLPTERKGPHIQGDVLKVLNRGWDMLIAHPTCTFLTNSGVCFLHDHVASVNGKRPEVCGSKRWVAMYEAAEFFNKLKNADVARICVENPIPHKYARLLIGKYTQVIQPWMFGHPETKATCLWLKGLPKLKPTKVVEGREQRLHFLSPSPTRWMERSRTFTGIAKAMAKQWG